MSENNDKTARELFEKYDRSYYGPRPWPIAKIRHMLGYNFYEKTLEMPLTEEDEVTYKKLLNDPNLDSDSEKYVDYLTIGIEKYNEELKKNIEINNKKIIVKIPNNELEFMEQCHTVMPFSNNGNNIKINIAPSIIYDLKRFKITHIYLLITKFDPESYGNKITFTLYPKNYLLSQHTFISEIFDKIFHSYFEDDGIKFYIHDFNMKEEVVKVKSNTYLYNKIYSSIYEKYDELTIFNAMSYYNNKIKYI
jgi:hypothetical protein